VANCLGNHKIKLEPDHGSSSSSQTVAILILCPSLFCYIINWINTAVLVPACLQIPEYQINENVLVIRHSLWPFTGLKVYLFIEGIRCPTPNYNITYTYLVSTHKNNLFDFQ
jgi:hypothetical protein